MVAGEVIVENSLSSSNFFLRGHLPVILMTTLLFHLLSSLSQRFRLLLVYCYLFLFWLFLYKGFLRINMFSVVSSKHVKLILAIVWCVGSLSENALDPFEEATNKSCFVVLIQIFE